jgi:competence protein ComEC
MPHPPRSPVFNRAAAFACIVLVLLIIAAGCTGLPGAKTSRQAANDGKLSAYFLDVGQGDAELLVFGNRTILIDAGETEQGDRVVADLQELGVTRIDLLVATHPHSDHIGGMRKVLETFSVGQVLDAGVPSTSPIYEHLLEEIEKEGIPYRVAEQGQTIDLDPSLRILVLSPVKERLSDDPNENSVVLRISYGTISFLFTGDMGGGAEDALTKTGYPLDAQILKVGHHGSEYSTSKEFLARVHPEVAIIEVGKDNPYGHPHQQTLQRLADTGATVYRTDRDGTILVRSDGTFYSVTTRTSGAQLMNRTPAVAQTSVAPAIPPLPGITLNATGLMPVLPANISVPVTLPPFQIGNASSVYISATQFNAPGDDRENLNGEWVRIANRGSDAVLIAGWTLSDRTGSHPYVFPPVVLLPSTSVTVFTGRGTLNDTALYMGQSAPIWGNSGDVAILRDGSGAIIDQKAEDGCA